MKITKMSLLTIIFGMVISQTGWLIAGIALLRVVYFDKWHFIPEDEAGSLSLLVGLSAVFLLQGVAKGRAIARALEKEKVVHGRLLKVKEDNSGENTEYQMSFECSDASGFRQSLEIRRGRNDLVLGDEFPILIDEQTGEGLLEVDLPGGTNIANYQGTQPMASKVFLRILVIPVLAFAPLLGLLPPVAMAFQHSPAFWGWSVVVQAIWLFANRRYFTFKATNICCNIKTRAESAKAHPAHPASGLR